MKKRILSLACALVLLAACFCTVADAEVLSDKNGRLYYSCQILLSAYEEITFKELDGGTYSYNDMEFTDYKLLFKADICGYLLTVDDDENVPEIIEKLLADPIVILAERYYLIKIGEYGPDIQVGDVNDNGVWDAVDYAMVKRAFLNTYELSEWQFTAAYVNNNGVIDIEDYAMIKRAVLGTFNIVEWITEQNT